MTEVTWHAHKNTRTEHKLGAVFTTDGSSFFLKKFKRDRSRASQAAQW